MDLLNLAAHHDHEVEYDGALIRVKRGQVPTSERRLADRWGWTRKKVRHFLGQLESCSRIVREWTRKGAHGLSLITICNYSMYQGERGAMGPTEGPTKGPRRAQTEEGKEGKDSPAVEIEAHRARYTPAQLEIIDRALDAFRTTRKTGRIADSIVLHEFTYWERFPVGQVIGGLRVYLQKGYAQRGKDEKYARGIIRNTMAEPEDPEDPEGWRSRPERTRL